MQKLKLGIIGGLGPAATVRLYERIVELTDADCDQEHLDITIFNRPQIPDRTAYLLGKPGAPSFVPPMQRAASQLEGLGCEVLCTPCNTAHSRYDDITSVLESANFVHMPREAALFAARIGCTKVGIMATDGAVTAGVYQDAAKRANIACEVPDEQGQRTVMSIIYDDVKAGRPVDFARFEGVVAQLAARGCDGVILGCTELSCVGSPTRIDGVAVVDALDVLAWRCVQECNAPARNLLAEFNVGA